MLILFILFWTAVISCHKSLLHQRKKTEVSFFLVLKILNPTDTLIDRFAELFLLLNEPVIGYNKTQCRKHYVDRK